MVGISSRTDRPDWEYEMLSKFSIYDDINDELLPPFPMQDVFTPELCILDKYMDKSKQFERLLQSANDIISGWSSKKLKYDDILFFDNEAGNCKAVAELGVTTVYCPGGLDQESWQVGLKHFPSLTVLSRMPN